MRDERATARVTAEPALVELVDRFGAARPADRESVDLTTYKGVRPPWNDWKYLEERSRFWAGRLAAVVLKP